MPIVSHAACFWVFSQPRSVRLWAGLISAVCLLIVLTTGLSASAWDGKWTQGSSGTWPFPDRIETPVKDSQGDAGISPRPQSYWIPPNPRFEEVDQRELKDYNGKDYSPYALARLTSDITLSTGKHIPKGYYLIKPGHFGDGSLKTRQQAQQAPQNRFNANTANPSQNMSSENHSPQNPSGAPQEGSGQTDPERLPELIEIPDTGQPMPTQTVPKLSPLSQANPQMLPSEAEWPGSLPSEEVSPGSPESEDSALKPIGWIRQQAQPAQVTSNNPNPAQVQSGAFHKKRFFGLFEPKPPYQVFVLKQMGKVIAVVPIAKTEPYIKAKGEKLPKQTIAWVEAEGNTPNDTTQWALKFLHKKMVYVAY